MKHSTIDNIIIYGSLILAVILIGYVLKESYKNKNKDESVISELENIFEKKEKNTIEKKAKEYIEPESVKNIDKLSVINNYFQDILIRKTENEVITYKTLHSWGAYEILNINYKKQIADNYYGYDIDIKIPNKEAIISGRLNQELTTDKYLVVTIEFDMLNENGNLIIKNVDV